MDNTAPAFRLTPQQARCWSAAAGCESTAWHTQLTALVAGVVTVDMVAAAWQTVAWRHESLRTRVTAPAPGAVPLQIVLDPQALRVEFHDWAGCASARRSARLDALLARWRSSPPDPAAGPPVRVALCTVGPERHLLCLTANAFCADGLSLRRVLDDLTSVCGGEPPLATPAQPADLAEWEHAMLASPDGEGARREWADALPLMMDAPASLLPDAPAPAGGSASLRLALDRETMRLLHRVCREQGIAVPAFVQATWQALIARAARRPVAAIACACDGRGLEELRTAVGRLARDVPIALPVSLRHSLADLARACDAARRHASANQYYFDWDAAVGVPGRPVAWRFEDRPARSWQRSGALRVKIVRESWYSDPADIVLSCVTGRTAASLVLTYEAARVGRGQVEWLAAAYRAMLTAAVRRPDAPIAELPLTGESARAVAGVDSRDVARAVVDLLPASLERQARATPDAVAVIATTGQVTYRQLHARANRLAAQLRRQRVGPEARVAIVGEHSVELLTALLATIKCGAAFVPLDAAWPAERQARVLDDCRPSIVVCHDQPRGAIVDCGVPLISAGTLDATRSTGGLARPAPVRDEGLLAIIYTSGSTGMPKGVMVTHAGIATCVASMQELYALHASDRFLWRTPLTFDPSLWETFWPLVTGAAVVVADDAQSGDPQAVWQHVQREQVTALYAVPSQLELLATHATRELAATLRRAICGGEPLRTESLERWLAVTGTELHHSYGPTETSIAACEWTCVSGWPRAVAAIGARLSNTRLSVVEAGSAQVVPDGMVGQLFIGGTGVGRGYWRRPASTAESFQPDPDARNGTRWYASGDLVRHLPGRVLEFIGRVDDQVKIRGVRIEPGEIEAVLRSHPDVDGAAVIVKHGPGDSRSLAGFWVPRASPGPDADEMRSYLAGRLPSAFVPAQLTTLERLPRTTAGKVDRRALAAIAPAEPRGSHVPPTTFLEQTLAELWGSVLKVDEVSIHDNFFELGGDSIISLRLIAAMRDAGLAVTVQDLFAAQTIARLVPLVAPIDGPRDEVPALQPFALVDEADRAKLPEDAEDAYPLAALQRGMLYEAEVLADTPMYHGVNSWTFRGRMVPELFQQAMDRVVARHPILRTSIDLSSFSEPLQIVHRTAHLRVHADDLRGLPDDEQIRIIDAFFEEQRRTRFDLARPPLLRFSVHLRRDDLFEFGLTECHAIVDGWSLTSTIGEAFRIYFALLDGEDPPIERPPASSFRDFVWAERRALASPESKTFWERHLADHTVLIVPQWPGATAGSGERIAKPNVVITAATAQGLRAIARSARVPLRSVLLAAHLKVLAVASGHVDIVTGLTAHGRLAVKDGDQVRGLFLNSIPFRMRLGGGSWADLARSTFQEELRLLPHARYPVAALRKNWRESPLFETLFNFVHFHALSDGLSDRLQRVGRGLGSEEINLPISVGFSQAPFDKRLFLMLHCDAWRMSREQIARLAGYYSRALAAMAANPAACHGDVELLGPGEIEESVQWSSGRSMPASGTLAAAVERQAGATADAVAVVDGDLQLTYGTLLRQARTVARRVSAHGAGPEDAVLVFVDHSCDAVVAALGVIIAGAAYLPVDPTHPPARTATIVRDAAPRLILTRRARLADLPDLDGVPVLCLDEDAHDAAHAAQSRRVDPGNLAYIIYTSGSTGQPKGVGVTHANVLHHLAGTTECLRPSRSDVWTWFHSLSFDYSVWEIWGCLTTGARLVVVPPNQRHAPDDLVRLIDEQRVTMFSQTPASFSSVLRGEGARGPRALTSLQFVIFSGDTLDFAALRPWYRLPACRQARLENMYGITETTVMLTTRTVRERDTQGMPRSVVGLPIANYELHVLDPTGQRSPVMAIGELHVGGPCVSRGYRHAPALTAQRFVPNPFADRPGERMYASGDLGRRLPDGDLEYLGRKDRQVKIKGFRIELGDIEGTIRQHPAVDATVVTVPANGDGGKRLAAYYVRSGTERVDPAALRAHVRQRLPAYMVPATFTEVAAIPLTSNGKVDLAALPAPDEPRRPVGESAAPRSEAEQAIAAVWREVLQVDHVGVNDNFFDSGGDSLQLATVHAKLRRIYGEDLAIVDLFRHSTVASFGAFLAARGSAAATMPVAPDIAGARHDAERLDRLRRLVSQR